MLAGVATHRTAEPVGEAAGSQKSLIRGVAPICQADRDRAGELMARDLSGEDIKVLMLDGEP